MARKNSSKSNEAPVTVHSIAHEIVTVATEAQQSGLASRLRIGQIMHERARHLEDASDIAARVGAAARAMFAKRDDGSLPSRARPVGLSNTALSKAETVFRVYVASGVATVERLCDINASLDKLYVHRDHPEGRAHVVDNYVSLPARPDRVTSEGVARRATINVAPELRDRFNAVAEHVAGDTSQARNDALMASMLDLYVATHGTPDNAGASDSASVSN